MIDARFPPQPDRLIVPLYPATEEPYKPGAPMALSLKDVFEPVLRAGFSRTFFADSASNCLAEYLLYLKDRQAQGICVALPAFICPHFCAVIRSIGVDILFLDIDETLFYPETQIHEALSLGVTVFLWPLFFGTREPPQRLLDLVTASGRLNIVDSAQSFPATAPKTTCNMLISFGRSKRLAAVGGGGLVFGRDTCFADFIASRSCSRPQGPPTQSLATPPPPQKWESDLPSLLNKIRVAPRFSGARAMSQQQINAARAGFDALSREGMALLRLYGTLRQFARKTFGVPSLERFTY